MNKPRFETSTLLAEKMARLIELFRGVIAAGNEGRPPALVCQG